MNFFMTLVEQVWTTKTVPKTWGNGKIEALWKGKGSKRDPTVDLISALSFAKV